MGLSPFKVRRAQNNNGSKSIQGEKGSEQQWSKSIQGEKGSEQQWV